jgi:competence ComEA-like helix-hairpin-helix protein
MKKIILLFLVFVFIAALSAPTGIFAAEKVDINTASLTQLDELTGIGPKYAQAIIDNRPYASVDDLVRVKGIGPVTLEKIKEQGLACVNCATQQEEVRPPEPAAAGVPPSETSSGEVGPPTTYATGIFINEILPAPQGADETNEWIEIYNSNNFEVNLAGWTISDTAGTITNYIFPENSIISANGFLVVKRPDTKIILNNDEDKLTLLAPDKTIKDSASYNKAVKNQSYNKIGSGWEWSTTLTPGTNNIVAAAAKSPLVGSGSGDLSKSKNSVKNNNTKAELADISLPAQAGQILNTNQKAEKTVNPWFLFLIAVFITIISAILVLFIKLKFNKKHVRT